MFKTFILMTILLISMILGGCNKKSHPSGTTSSTTGTNPVKRNTIKTAVPKVIIVNDKYAKRSVDGRYYYDLEGHRYWRNNRDGKYYLFHKSMFDNKDFKSPVKQ